MYFQLVSYKFQIYVSHIMWLSHSNTWLLMAAFITLLWPVPALATWLDCALCFLKLQSLKTHFAVIYNQLSPGCICLLLRCIYWLVNVYKWWHIISVERRCLFYSLPWKWNHALRDSVVLAFLADGKLIYSFLEALLCCNSWLYFYLEQYLLVIILFKYFVSHHQDVTEKTRQINTKASRDASGTHHWVWQAVTSFPRPFLPPTAPP